jgi:hypothetical protein
MAGGFDSPVTAFSPDQDQRDREEVRADDLDS